METLTNNATDVEKMLRILLGDFKTEIAAMFKQIGYNTVQTSGNDNIVLQDVTAQNITINQIPKDLLAQFADQLKDLIELKQDKTKELLRHNVPARPSYFVGRAEKLAEIHQKMTQTDNRQNIFLVSGVGGMGKTTLVQEYVNTSHCQLHFQRMVYVSVQDNLESAFIHTVASAFEIDMREYPKNEDQKRVITYALKECKGNNLVYIDNANNKDQLEQCAELFKGSGWKFLITTRTQPDKFRLATIDVNELLMPEAASLFLHYYAPLAADQNELTGLLNHIHRHTLLTELLAKVGIKKGLTVLRLSEILKEQDRLLKAMNNDKIKSKIDIGEHATATGMLEYDTLHHYILSLFEPEKLNDEHITMVRFFSVLPSDDISIAHLKILWRVSEPVENTFDDNLDYLKQWGWLSGKHKQQTDHRTQTLTYKMHPLVQEVVYDKLTPDINNCEPLVITISEMLTSNDAQSFVFQPYAKSVIDKLNLLNDRKA